MHELNRKNGQWKPEKKKLTHIVQKKTNKKVKKQ